MSSLAKLEELSQSTISQSHKDVLVIDAIRQVSGGRDAEPEEMSYMAALGYSDGNEKEIDWRCGGTLVSESFILTAAHCLFGHGKPPTHVLLGIKSLRDEAPNRVLARIQTIYIHPEYNRPTKYHDLGLIKLDRELTISQYVYPACLPQPIRRLELINETITGGWGRLEFFGNRAETLQVTTLKRYSMKECNAMYTEGSPDLRLPLPEGFMKSQICAGDIGYSKNCKPSRAALLQNRRFGFIAILLLLVTNTVVAISNPSIGDTLHKKVWQTFFVQVTPHNFANIVSNAFVWNVSKMRGMKLSTRKNGVQHVENAVRCNLGYVPYANLRFCKRTPEYKLLNTINNSSGNKDTCDGDSGGPLIVRENITDCTQFVVGITSFGDHFCGSGIPAVYTNVQSYLDWIEEVVWGASF